MFQDVSIGKTFYNPFPWLLWRGGHASWPVMTFVIGEMTWSSPFFPWTSQFLLVQVAPIFSFLVFEIFSFSSTNIFFILFWGFQNSLPVYDRRASTLVKYEPEWCGGILTARRLPGWSLRCVLSSLPFFTNTLSGVHMEVFTEKRGTPKNHPNFSRVFHYKSSILGSPHFWKPPYIYIYVYVICVFCKESLTCCTRSWKTRYSFPGRMVLSQIYSRWYWWNLVACSRSLELWILHDCPMAHAFIIFIIFITFHLSLPILSVPIPNYSPCSMHCGCYCYSIASPIVIW